MENKDKKKHSIIIISPKTTLAVIVTVLGLVWIVWQMSSSHHRAEIESLQQTLTSVTNAYQLLSSKTSGLLEPRLLYVDTLRFDALTIIYVLGGRVSFAVSLKENYLFLGYHNTIDSESYDISLRPSERFEFQAKQRTYYIVFEFSEIRDFDVVISKIYELQPLYRPTEVIQTKEK